ncbi:helix-turn-helix domain-containing protein [Marinilactibacillus psychrotolerans]|uniref:helix-turn-helix domain-containing protein n=1 Tax=Marinilactibacillus psychrotolerans TaxID=191770 RepID=UPI0038837482
MAKYSFEFKLKIVNKYRKGSLGYTLLAKKYGLPSRTPVKKWIQMYQHFGEDGLKRKNRKKSNLFI